MDCKQEMRDQFSTQLNVLLMELDVFRREVDELLEKLINSTPEERNKIHKEIIYCLCIIHSASEAIENHVMHTCEIIDTAKIITDLKTQTPSWD